VLLTLPLFGIAKEPAAPTETVIRLKVQPAPAPKPALRYQLLPELREMEPGNAILGYLKCFMEQQNFFFKKEAVEKREKWAEMPLEDLPVKEVRAAGYRKDMVPLRQADYAARLDHADWQTLLPLRREGITLLIPEVQQLRGLAWALRVRLRADVAERHFDDALVTAQTMLALARHIGEHPTLIGDLVGIAIVGMTIPPLEEMLQRPGCPNLYWALTDLPDPLIGLRQALQGERLFLDKHFPGLSASKPMTEAQLTQIPDQITDQIRQLRGVVKSQIMPQGGLAALAGTDAHVGAARRRLIASGLPEELVKQFPPLQVVLLDARLGYETDRDDAFKALQLPFWQAEKVFTAGKTAEGGKGSFFGNLLPAAMKVRQAQARTQQRIGLLRCVEALRMYAAENQGRLPARLEELKVPLPVDPVTGKSFVYRLEGRTATIRGTPPPGLEKNAFYNVRYEVTIVK